MTHLLEDHLAALRPDALAPAQVARKALAVGEAKASLPAGRAFVLAMLAGIFISFGATVMLVVKADATLSFGVSQVLSGLVFSVGLFLVVTAGAELFTGNNLMILGALEGRYGAGELLRAWLIVYLGNLAGSLLMAGLVHLGDIAAMGGGAVGEAAVAVASAKASLAPGAALFRGVLCNILVCLAVWMSFATRTVVDKICICVLPVMAFVACGFEHCVANMFFLPFGMLCDGAGVIEPASVAANIALATCGNIIGGAIIVSGAYWLAFLRNGEA